MTWHSFVQHSFVPNCNIFLLVLSIFICETSLLLLNNFYPVISYRWVQKENDELLCTVLVARYGPQSVASSSGRPLALERRATHVENVFVPKLHYFLKFKYTISITQAEQIINLLLLNNFYPVTSYHTDEFRKKATNYCVRFWSLVMVRESSCQRKGLHSRIKYWFCNCFSRSSLNFSQCALVTLTNHIYRFANRIHPLAGIILFANWIVNERIKIKNAM